MGRYDVEMRDARVGIFGGGMLVVQAATLRSSGGNVLAPASGVGRGKADNGRGRGRGRGKKAGGGDVVPPPAK